MRDLILKMSMSLDGFVGGPTTRSTGSSPTTGGDRLDRGDGLERRRSHHGQPHVRRHGRVLADFDRSVRAADERDPESRLHETRRGDPEDREDRARHNRPQRRARECGDRTSATPQPGGESWAKPFVASGDLAEEIAKLKAQDGKPIVAHGGASSARSLIATGLVDQYALLVHPVALGKGLPIFADLAAPMPLTLVSARVFPKGAVAQIYRPG